MTDLKKWLLTVQAANDRTQKTLEHLIRKDTSIIDEIAREIFARMDEEAELDDEDLDEVRMMLLGCALFGLSQLVHVIGEKAERRLRRKKKEEGDGPQKEDDPG